MAYSVLFLQRSKPSTINMRTVAETERRSFSASFLSWIFSAAVKWVITGLLHPSGEYEDGRLAALALGLGMA